MKENGKPVFFYQKEPKSLDGKYVCDNYLHPLYSLSGDTLTEEFPADHPYHRGIFWAWHQVHIDNKSVGDGWVMENIEQKVVDVQTVINDHVGQLEINALWKSPLYENKKPFIAEHTTISLHPLEDSVRKIDFAIRLKALVPHVEIGGADDEKGYGGLCARIRLPEDIIFTSANGMVTPQTYQVKAGPWMDFSASYGKNNEMEGIAILCHPKTPNYPAPWILRAEKSMQNIVFPGRDRVTLPTEGFIILYYRLIVHSGNADDLNLSKLQLEYAEKKITK